ncbi:MAG: FtsQ-type POTRA domain-containing protein [Aquificae bacterium]|nr:FtsQ-type POTRA domain-containing protein [Aquificota bacterium]
MKNSKRKKRYFVAGLVFVSCAVVCVSIFVLPELKRHLKVKRVVLGGTGFEKKIPKSYVEKLFTGQNWLLLEEQKIKKELKKRFPFVKEVVIKRRGIGEIYLYIKERKPILIVFYKGRKYLVDSEGVVLPKKYYNTQHRLPILIYNDRVVADRLSINGLFADKIRKVYKLNKELGQVAFCVKYIGNRDKLTCKTKKKQQFIFSFSNLDEEIGKAKLFFSKVDTSKYSILDFRFKPMVVAGR